MAFLDKESEILVPELKKWDEGFCFIAGIDEVGRGPLAGPVVAAAVVFPKYSELIPLVNDSKKLSEKQRIELQKQILEVPGIQYATAEVSPEEIDRINILAASHLAMKKAAAQLDKVDFALIDGLPVKGFPIANQAIVKGDSKSASIAAASIIAKVYRDALMDKFASLYPEYGFESHKGYGTADHLAALKKHGPCPIHRKTFAPVRDIIYPPPEQQEFSF